MPAIDYEPWPRTHAEHRTSQGPAATVPVWAIERALDGGEGA